MHHANLNFKPKGCFRVLSGRNANVPRPPLIVDFPTEYHKRKFLSQCIGTIKEFKDSNELMIYCSGRRRYGRPHWINSIFIAPDRSFEDRQR